MAFKADGKIGRVKGIGSKEDATKTPPPRDNKQQAERPAFKPNGKIGAVKGKGSKDRTPAAMERPTPSAKKGGLKPLPTKVSRSKPLDTEFEVGPVSAWSFSSLKRFEECPLAIYYKSVEKIKEPGSEAMERGSRIHQLAEDYVQGKMEKLPPELGKFEQGFADLQREYERGKVLVEEDWGFRKDWSPCGWTDPEVWHRAKLDVMLFESDTSARVIDHKTGKKYGNEMKHSEQGLIYTIDAFLLHPKLEMIQWEFWYLDKAETMTRKFTRRQALLFHSRWHERGRKMTSAVDFPANPSPSNCKWCYFGKEGICPYKFEL